MSAKKIDREYVSDIDKFLREFDKTHPLSASQQKEITKNGKIAHLRDDPKAPHRSENIWEKF